MNLLDNTIKVLAISNSNSERSAVRRYRMTRVLQERTRIAKASIKSEMEKAKEDRRRILNFQLQIYETLNTIISALDAIKTLIELFEERYPNEFYIVPGTNFEMMKKETKRTLDTLLKVDPESGSYIRDSSDGGVKFNEEAITQIVLEDAREKTLELVKGLVDIIKAEKEYEPTLRKLLKFTKKLTKITSGMVSKYGSSLIPFLEIKEGRGQIFRDVTLFELDASLNEYKQESLNALDNRPVIKRPLAEFKKYSEYLENNMGSIQEFLSELKSKEKVDKDFNQKSIKEDINFIERALEDIKDKTGKLDLQIELADIKQLFSLDGDKEELSFRLNIIVTNMINLNLKPKLAKLNNMTDLLDTVDTREIEVEDGVKYNVYKLKLQTEKVKGLILRILNEYNS